MRKLEMYYGYYDGNAQVWDTDYVEIPDDTTDEELEKVACEAFSNSTKQGFAFCGIYNEDVEADEDY